MNLPDLPHIPERHWKVGTKVTWQGQSQTIRQIAVIEIDKGRYRIDYFNSKGEVIMYQVLESDKVPA